MSKLNYKQIISKMNNEGYCNTEFIINSLGNYTPEDSDWNYKDVPHLNIVHKNVEGLLAIVDDNFVGSINFLKIPYIGIALPLIFVNYEDSNKEDMQGLLIYTSAGDSEGTMGGLVRLGEPEFFNKIFVNALRKALWCSTDPVCNETPRQGPFGLNQGACYSCCLLPETSCDVTNTFLDRGFVVGTQSNPDIGVFNL